MPPQFPDLPSRTKVVRLIVLPSAIDPANVAAVQQFARSVGAAKSDAFIVKNLAEGTWHPMSWLGGALVDHEEATRTDKDCTAVVSVSEREQLQWESSVEFWVDSISRKDSVVETRLNPFESLPKGVRGGLGKPIRSGPPTMQYEYTQLYKMTFGMVLEGREVIIDPDVICEWH